MAVPVVRLDDISKVDDMYTSRPRAAEPRIRPAPLEKVVVRLRQLHRRLLGPVGEGLVQKALVSLVVRAEERGEAEQLTVSFR